ncbi:MAG: hypothetical protein VKN72_06615 [Nostocales cyanobacterium 94392]|nr:hypothetical protein [Nostocales cyanobacterium 94392]
MGRWGDKGMGGWGDGKKITAVHYQLSTINYQLSTINYQLSTINYQLTPVFISHFQIFLSPNCYNESKLSNYTPVKNSDRTFNYFNWLKNQQFVKSRE